MPAMDSETGRPVRPGYRVSPVRWLTALLLLAVTAVGLAIAIHLISGRF